MPKPTVQGNLKVVTNMVTLIPLAAFLTFGPLTKIDTTATKNVAAAPAKDLPNEKLSLKSPGTLPVFKDVKASASVQKLAAAPVAPAATLKPAPAVKPAAAPVAPVVAAKTVEAVSSQASYQDEYGSDVVGDSVSRTLKNVKVILADEGGDPWDEGADSGNVIRQSDITLGATADKGSLQSSILTSSAENVAEVSMDNDILATVANAASLSLSLQTESAVQEKMANAEIDTGVLASIATAASVGLQSETNGVTPGTLTETVVDGWSGDELTV